MLQLLIEANSRIRNSLRPGDFVELHAPVVLEDDEAQQGSVLSDLRRDSAPVQLRVSANLPHDAASGHLRLTYEGAAFLVDHSVNWALVRRAGDEASSEQCRVMISIEVRKLTAPRTEQDHFQMRFFVAFTEALHSARKPWHSPRGRQLVAPDYMFVLALNQPSKAEQLMQLRWLWA